MAVGGRRLLLQVPRLGMQADPEREERGQTTLERQKKAGVILLAVGGAARENWKEGDSAGKGMQGVLSGTCRLQRGRKTMFGLPAQDFAAVEFVLKVVGALAVIIALFLTWRTHTERSTFEMIDRLYTLCHTLEGHLLKDWRLSHLFCIGAEEYNQTKERVAQGLGEQEKQEYLVKERLFAIHVFVVYEQVYYQWKHTSWWMHRRRRVFLREMLSYFSERLLCNPRLVGFLQSDPTGVGLHLETWSRAFIEGAVKRAKVVDTEVPFAGPAGLRLPVPSSPPPPK